MSLLANLAVDDSIETSKDTLGGARGPLESGVYDATVKSVHFETSKGGALAASLALDIEGREVRQKLWITSGDAKGNKNYYEKEGKKHFLPGFEQFRSLSLMTLGSEPSDLETTDGVLKLYNRETQKEEPTSVPLVRDFAGKTIKVGMLKQIVDKNARNEQTGAYEPTGETREENEIDKFFHAESGMTLAEAMGGDTEGTFIKAWAERNTGNTRDRSTKDVAAAPRATAPVFSQAGAAPTATKLFG